MRVLFCIHSLAGGGAETQARIIANSLIGLGCDVGFFYVKGVELDEGLRYYRCREGAYPLGLVSEIRKAIIDFKPDLVHAWVPATLNISTLIASRLCGVPAISSIRNRRQFDSALRVFSFLTTVALAKKIVTNNPIEQSASYYQWLYKIKKGTQINNAVSVNLADFEPAHTNIFTIVYVGRLTRQKNVKLLIEALASIRSTSRWQLLIFGKGEEESALQRLALENEVTKQIKFLGYDSDLGNIFRKADLLILPSLYEGMPNVVVEAMAYGIPALVSNIPAHTLLFKNSEVGFFTSNDKMSLGDQIAKYMNGGVNVQQQLQMARTFVDAHKPIQIAQEYKNLYQNMIDQN